MINIPVVFVILTILFTIINLALWVVVMMGSKENPEKSGEKKSEESLLESTVTEMLNIFKDVEDMVNEIRKDNKRIVNQKPELPSNFTESINENRENIKKLKDNIEKLSSNIDGNSSRMENIKNLMEDIDSNLVKFTELMEKTKKG